MKAHFLLILLLSLIFSGYQSQITLINTGTSSDLSIPPIINNNIIINGYQHYLSKSYDGCDNLIPLTAPGPSGYWNIISRPDTQAMYILSSDLQAYNSQIYKSVDGGYHWALKLDTPNYYVDIPAFFDSTEGVALGTFGKLIRTKNGGNTWLNGSHPLTVVTTAKVYGDSIVGIGGDLGDFLISKNRGNTWFGHGSFGTQSSPADFFFLNKDTIFVIGTMGSFPYNFAKSFNGGLNWQYSAIFNALVRPYGLYAKSKDEIYAVGVTSGTIGIILKTTDLGQNWSSFNTHIKSELSTINFLNDSIALVSGSNGVLFKWNSKTAIYTGINELKDRSLGMRIYPNPASEILNVEVAEINGLVGALEATIYNNLGQAIFDEKLTFYENTAIINTKKLPNGVYVLDLKSGISGTVSKRFIVSR